MSEPLFASERTVTRLHVGDVILFEGGEAVVEYVNLSRARCRPLAKNVRRITDGVTGVSREIAFSQASFNVSPQSDCAIIRRIST